VTGGLVEMALVRRGDAVRMNVTYEGVAPLTIIISPAGSGPCLLETRHLSFRYEGTTITAQQERILRSIAGRLGDATFDEIAQKVPEEDQERGAVDPEEIVDRGVVTVEQWGAPDAWRRFVFRREFERNASSALRVTGRRVVTVSHGESECQYATPAIDARSMSLFCYPWIRPLAHVPNAPAPERSIPSFITTDMRDADIITGGAAKLDAVLDALADRTCEGDVVVVRSTCMPHVIGDDMQESVRRWSGRGDIIYDDVFAPAGRDLTAELLAAAIDSGKRRKRRGSSVALAGIAPGPALVELEGLLVEAGIDVVSALVPRIDLERARDWRRAAVQVLVPDPYRDALYESVFRPLPLETIEPPTPHGVADTRRWLEAIARSVGREAEMRRAWKRRMRRCAAERRRLRQDAAGVRLGFVVDADECAALGDPVKMAGVPVLGVVCEMGFGIDLMVYGDGPAPDDRPGVEIHRFDDRESLQRLMRDLPCGAIYSDLYCDARITAAGKMPFCLQLFEPGLEGAVRTAERLVGACRADFYRKYGTHGRTH